MVSQLSSVTQATPPPREPCPALASPQSRELASTAAFKSLIKAEVYPGQEEDEKYIRRTLVRVAATYAKEAWAGHGSWGHGGPGTVMARCKMQCWLGWLSRYHRDGNSYDARCCQ